MRVRLIGRTLGFGPGNLGSSPRPAVMDSDLLKYICCCHNLTTEPDENGDAVCLKCGLIVQIRFNMDRFIEALNRLRES